MNPDNSVQRLLLSVAVIFAGGAALVGVAAPASAAAVSEPQLQVSVVVSPSKATYAVGDAVTTTFVVTNSGTATATNVHIVGGDDEGLSRAGDPPTDAFDVAPGESHSLPWAATISQGAAVLSYAFGVWSFADDQGQNVQGKYRIEPVPGMTGPLDGKVFPDVKGNYDATQPGLAGVTVTATSQRSGEVASATTDQAGQFSMPNLAAGDYQIRVVGWTIEGATGNVTSTLVMGGRQNRLQIAIVPNSGPKPSTPTATPRATPTATATPHPTATGPDAPTGSATAAPTATRTDAGPASPSISNSAVPLPTTGSPTGLMATIGMGVVLVGVVAVVVSRRRRDSAQNRTTGPGGAGA